LGRIRAKGGLLGEVGEQLGESNGELNAIRRQALVGVVVQLANFIRFFKSIPGKDTQLGGALADVFGHDVSRLVVEDLVHARSCLKNNRAVFILARKTARGVAACVLTTVLECRFSARGGYSKWKPFRHQCSIMLFRAKGRTLLVRL
jgi:hypothetical protein